MFWGCPPDRPPAAAVGGVPWGPLLYPEGAHGAPYFTQPGTQGPLLYPGGAHGAPPWGPFPGKKFSRLCRENFFPPSRSWGPHGAPDLWSICLIYIEICSFSWIFWIWQRFKWVLWLKYSLYTIFWKFKVKNFEIWDLGLSLRPSKKEKYFKQEKIG